MTKPYQRTYAWAEQIDWPLFFACVSFLCGDNVSRLGAHGLTWREALEVQAHKRRPTQPLFLRICGALHLRPEQLYRAIPHARAIRPPLS